MQKLIAILATVALCVTAYSNDLVATIYSKLQWEDTNPPETTSGFNIHFTGPTNAAVFVPGNSAVTNAVNLTNIFRAYDNGEFKVTVSAVSKSGLESEQSTPLFYFWYGRVLPVTNLVHSFNRINDN